MKIPYSPRVAMVESYVAIYKIYVLKNPLKDNEIFYVGQTFKSLNERLVGHIAETGANREKINYIKEIIEGGSRPIIESVEVIHGTCYIDKMLVNEREYFWIRYYLTLGCRLLNSAGTSPSSRCIEYHSYLASLKKGETKYHYYYCGKTAGGYEVYDEEKLKVDGFVLKEPPKPEVKKEEPEPPPKKQYNPWSNRRFVGYSCEKKWSLVTTEVFPAQPRWSAEFLKGLDYIDGEEFDFWHEFDEDGCDNEPDVDDEADAWAEPDFDDEEFWQPEHEDEDWKEEYFLGTA